MTITKANPRAYVDITATFPVSLIARAGDISVEHLLKWDSGMAELRGSYRGMNTIIRRNQVFGFWLGYVGIPWWRPDLLIPAMLRMADLDDCTYAGWGGRHRNGGPLPRGTFWIGLDFGTGEDAFPILDPDHPQLARGTYRDAADAVIAIERLADGIRGLRDGAFRRLRS